MVIQRDEAEPTILSKQEVVEKWFVSKVENELNSLEFKNLQPLIVNIFYSWRAEKIIPKPINCKEKGIGLFHAFIACLVHVYHLCNTPDYQKNGEDLEESEFLDYFFSVLQTAYNLENDQN